MLLFFCALVKPTGTRCLLPAMLPASDWEPNLPNPNRFAGETTLQEKLATSSQDQLSSTKAPPQEEPDPAVQPKQCEPVMIGIAVKCSMSISQTSSGLPLASCMSSC